jgi:hypothetical protein
MTFDEKDGSNEKWEAQKEQPSEQDQADGEMCFIRIVVCRARWHIASILPFTPLCLTANWNWN